MKAHVRWLLDELPRLQRDGLLDAAAAARLREHYAAIAAGSGWSRVLFPLLGVVLIALGIILLVAHNWDEFGRPLRLALAFAPLLLGQIACVWTLWRARDSTLWREASAAFTVLSFAAALALVGQIYHFPGDLDRYLLSCALVALPLAYALNATLAAALCALALSGWAWAVPGSGPPVFVVAGVFALLLPLVWLRLQRAPQALATLWLLGLLAPAFFVAVLAALPNVPRLGLWWLAEFGALLLLLPVSGSSSAWRQPLRAWGGAAVAIAALTGSFPDVWRGWFWYLRPEQLPQAWAFLVLGMALLAVLAWRTWRRGTRAALLWTLPALLMALVAATDSRPLAIVLALLLSAWLLLAGIVLIRSGLRDQDAGRATRGLALIALLVMLRFVDNEWSFTLRGIAFVLTGAAFVAAHLWLRRQVRT
jgi:uncharacterized membrane protein